MAPGRTIFLNVPYLILLGVFNSRFVIVMCACASMHTSLYLRDCHSSYWWHRYYVLVLGGVAVRRGRLQKITRNGRGFNDHTCIHTVMHIDRDGVFLLAHSEEMPRSALIGRAVPLLDPWDRSKSIPVQLRIQTSGNPRYTYASTKHHVSDNFLGYS